MEVGQIIFLEQNGNASRYSNKITEAKITKIGNKFFYLDKFPRDRFFIKSMKHDGKGYISKYNCYSSLKEIQDKIESKKLYQEIKEKFDSCRNCMNLEKLREIKSILK